MVNAKKIGGSVREQRKALGWTQIQLAECAGCAEETIRRFERGDIPDNRNVLNRVLRVLEQAQSGTIELTPREQWIVKSYRQAHPHYKETVETILSKVGVEPPETVPAIALAPPHRRTKLPVVDEPMVSVRYEVDLAAGIPTAAERQPDEVEVPARLLREHRDYRVTRARGNSMSAINILDGDLVLVENVRSTKNYRGGQVVVFQIGDGAELVTEGAIKRFAGTANGERRFEPCSLEPGHEILRYPTKGCQVVGVVTARRSIDGEWHQV